MRLLPRLLVLAVLAVLVAAPAGGAASKIVVRGTLTEMAFPKASFTSAKGAFTATWIGPKRYKLVGTIDGKHLLGSIRTHQTKSKKRFKARGSGTLGSRAVKIGGGGPNSLRKVTLVLR